MILKVLGLFGNPVLLGLGLLTLAHVYLLSCLKRGCDSLGISPKTSELAQIFMALCPVLAFTLNHLNLDGIFAVLAFSLAVQTLRISSSESVSSRSLLCCGFTLFLLANTKITGLIFYPPVIFMLALKSRKGGFPDISPMVRVAFLSLMILGLAHYVLLTIMYGSVLPEELYRFSFPKGDFVDSILKRSRSQMSLYFLANFPFTVIFLLPQSWRSLLNSGAGGRFMAALTVYIAALIFLMSYNQERYWAPFLPSMYLASAFIYDRALPARKNLFQSIALISGFLMTSTLFWNNQGNFESAVVKPALFAYLPFLQSLYR